MIAGLARGKNGLRAGRGRVTDKWNLIGDSPRYSKESLSLNSEVGVGFHGEFLPVFVVK
jgi:hypothetical protein